MIYSTGRSLEMMILKHACGKRRSHIWWMLWIEGCPSKMQMLKSNLYIMLFREGAFGRSLGLHKVVTMAPHNLPPCDGIIGPTKKEERRGFSIKSAVILISLFIVPSSSLELGKGALSLTPWHWTSSLQDCEAVNFYSLNHQDYIILLWKPKLTRTRHLV